MEPRNHFEDSAHFTFGDCLNHTLSAKHEGKLRAATHKTPGCLYRVRDAACRGQVDAKGLLREQILPR